MWPLQYIILKPKVEDASKALKRTEKYKNDSYEQPGIQIRAFRLHGEW